MTVVKLDPRRARQLFFAGNALVALAVSGCLLGLLGAGAGSVPALGCLLVPGHGAWSAGPAGSSAPSGQSTAGRVAPQVLFEPVVTATGAAGRWSVFAAVAAKAQPVCGHVR